MLLHLIYSTKLSKIRMYLYRNVQNNYKEQQQLQLYLDKNTYGIYIYISIPYIQNNKYTIVNT